MPLSMNKVALAISLTCLLSACGGGGEEATTPPPAIGPVSGDFILQAEDYQAHQGTIETEEADDGTVINYFNTGDYIEFSINIDQGGLYEVTYRAASPESDAIAELWLTNHDGTELISIGHTAINTGSWSDYADFVASQHFNIWSAGSHTIRLLGAGSSEFQFNTNYLSFRRLGEVDNSLDIDSDGVADIEDLCPASPSNESVNADGCADSQLDDDNDGVNNAADLCPDTPPGVTVDASGCEYTGDVIDVNTANPALPSFVAFDNTTPSGKRWQKVDSLSDEFDAWDASKWVKTNWNYGDTPVNMLNQNSGVSEGNLWIKATLNRSSQSQWFETSRVRSQAKIRFPMYTESRIKVANISAYSTYWLNNGDSNNRDEIDIIEINPTPTCGCQPEYPWQMNSQYFIVKNGAVERNKGDSDNRNLSDNNTLKGVRWNEDYHVFGAWWKDAHTVQFYLDGEAVNSVTTTQAFTLEQHIIWDLWTQDSSWVGGLPAQDDLLNDDNNTMTVDWVRTWQLVDE